MGRESFVRADRRDAKLPRLRWITRSGIVRVKKAINHNIEVAGRRGERLANPERHAAALYTGDLVSVASGPHVVRTSVEAFDRYTGTPCTAPLPNYGRVRLLHVDESTRWARGHVDDDGAAALLAAVALSRNQAGAADDFPWNLQDNLSGNI